jgi:hypothetical protein
MVVDIRVIRIPGGIFKRFVFFVLTEQNVTAMCLIRLTAGRKWLGYVAGSYSQQSAVSWIMRS